MKSKILPFLLFILVICGCNTCPKNFTYFYQNQHTGLEQLIDINGYYVSQRGCDSVFYSIYMFYANGLFSIATTDTIFPELTNCFEQGEKSAICKYPLWGTYRVENNLIRTQVVRPEGNGCVIFRDYRILPDKRIINVSDYVQPEHTNLAYMTNYPSFMNSPCEKTAEFFPLKTKRDSTECPLLKEKWFLKK